MAKKQTADVIIIALTGIVAFVIVATTVAVIIIEINDFTVDTDAIVLRLAQMVNTMMGAIIGYVAGRGTPNRSASDES